MTGFLLDTNVVSEGRKPSPDPGVVAWLVAHDRALLSVSVLTLGEIRFGIDKLATRDRDAGARLEEWFAQLSNEYSDRALGVDRLIADVWGRLRARRPLPTVDGLLAATAQVHGLTLVTRNVRDFDGLGVSVLNPFTR